MTKWKTDYTGNAVAATYFQRSNDASADGVNSTPHLHRQGPAAARSACGTLDEFNAAIAAVGPPAS